MLKLDMILLYVADAQKSADFYQTLLDQAPIHTDPTFAMFMLADGLRLGLWKRDTVKPPVEAATAGTSEIAFAVADTSALNALHAQWVAKGVTIIQPVVELDFGPTFTAADPDGHRIRASAMVTRD